MKMNIFNFSSSVLLVCFSFIGLSTTAQEGFYGGGGLLFLHAAEQVTNADNTDSFTAAADFGESTATFPQAFPNIGVGGFVGYKHIFGKSADKVRFWTGMEFNYNLQGMTLTHTTQNIEYKTEVDYSFGPSIKIGVQYQRLSAFANIFGFMSQRWNNSNSQVPDGIIYDLDDSKESRGPEHPTYANGYHTGVRTMGIGLEYNFSSRIAARMEYTASKHVEYRNENISGSYFDSGLGVYQASIGVTYYIWSPKQLKADQ